MRFVAPRHSVLFTCAVALALAVGATGTLRSGMAFEGCGAIRVKPAHP